MKRIPFFFSIHHNRSHHRSSPSFPLHYVFLSCRTDAARDEQGVGTSRDASKVDSLVLVTTCRVALPATVAPVFTIGDLDIVLGVVDIESFVPRTAG